MKYFLLIFSLLPIVGISQDIKIMTYNIRYDNPYDGINSWKEGNRKDKVLAIIEKQNPDILGVQEALHHQKEILENKFPDYQSVGVGRDDGKQEGEYAAIFFRKDKFQLLDSGYFWLSQTPDTPSKGWDATCCNRICTWVKLQHKRTIFYVFNTHFDHEGALAQQQSADLVLQKINSIAQTKKVILMGDFNMTPKNPAIIKLGKHLQNTQLSKANERQEKGTYNDFNADAPLLHIDYIFLKGGIKPIKYEIVNTLIDGLYPSDHFPVKVSLKL